MPEFTSQQEVEKMVSDYADTIYTYTDMVVRYCISITDSQDYIEKEKRFFYTLLFKVSGELEAVSILFKNFYQKPSLQGSMYLVLRTIISDCFCAMFIIKQKEEKKDFKREIDIIYADHVLYAIKTLKGTYNMIHRLRKSKIEEVTQTLKAYNQQFFTSETDAAGQITYGDFIYGNEHYSMKNAIRFLTQLKLIKEEKELLIKMFYYYDYYSKFEHLGSSTFSLIHKAFDIQAHKTSLRDVIENIMIIHIFIEMYLKSWPEIFDNQNEDYLRISEEVFKAGDLIWQTLNLSEI